MDNKDMKTKIMSIEKAMLNEQIIDEINQDIAVFKSIQKNRNIILDGSMKYINTTKKAIKDKIKGYKELPSGKDLSEATLKKLKEAIEEGENTLGLLQVFVVKK